MYSRRVESSDIFTCEYGTYAKSDTKELKLINVNNLRKGSIAAYYKDNELTHTARYRKNSEDDLVWSSKLGNGHVVEYEEALLLSEVYGDTINYYSELS